MSNKLYIALFFIVILLSYCAPVKKANIIGIYYKKANPYNETEIFRDLSERAFKYNYQIIKEGYDVKPEYKVIKKFYKKGVKIIILEDYSSFSLKKILKYVEKKQILLSVITDKTLPYIPILNITDFKKLGHDIAHGLYSYTRSKRNTFVIMYNDDHADSFRKRELLHGYFKYFKTRNGLTILTNTYKSTNTTELKKRIRALSSQFSNNLRGILMDNDSSAVKMAYILRRIGKENEIKIAGFDTTLRAIDSMMKTGLVVTGDINRYGLFCSAFTNSLIYYSDIMNKNKYMTNVVPGVCYNQNNLMDRLANTRKFSIKQIFKSK